jgi:hypothetical protein
VTQVFTYELGLFVAGTTKEVFPLKFSTKEFDKLLDYVVEWMRNLNTTFSSIDGF